MAAPMLRKLTKLRTDGSLYQRRPQVEALLGQLVELDRYTLVERLKISNRTAPAFVPTECLIYLLREAVRGNTAQWFNVLFAELDRRCRANLARAVAAGSVADAETVREEILGRFAEILAVGLKDDPARLDPFEVVFDKCFAALRIDGHRKTRARERREEPLEVEKENEKGEVLSRQFRQEEAAEAFGMSNVEFSVFRKQIGNAIGCIPDKQREVILLRLQGLPIDSDDPNTDTIAKRVGVDERTVRNRIKRGIEEIRALTQGNDDDK